MSKITTGTPVTAPITPGSDDTNAWPTHIAKYGKGGFEVVDTIKERDLITSDRREDKAVLVRVGSNGEPELFEYSNDSWNEVDLGDGIGTTNITFNDGTFTVGGIDTAIVNSMTVRQGSDASSAVITPYATFTDKRTSGTTDEGGQTYVPVEANKISLLHPLQMFSDPNEDLGVIMEIKHNSFEPKHADSYLAYIGYPIEIISQPEAENYHANSRIWPTDIVVDGHGDSIATNMAKKSVGIQEGDELDPNVTGGADFLVAYRVSLFGTAPDEGRVRIYLAQGQKFDESSDIVVDIDNQTMAVEKHYKAGDTLGDLEVVGVINAKGLTNLTMHIVHTFTSENIIVNERAKGISGIMVQALNDKFKTGQALIQYELDTRQIIEFSREWLGQKRMSFDSVVTHTSKKQTGAAGQGITLADGLHFYNPSPAATEVSNGQLIISDDGSNICDFSLGKFFGTSESVALRGKQVDVTLEINNSTNGWNLYLLKWTGAPDKYSKEIFKTRDGGGMPIWESGWGVGDVKFISEDVTSGTHAVTKVFTVPKDANNYAVIIAPVEAEIPMTLKLSKFELDVVNPFYMYEMYQPNKLDEVHLRASEEFIETLQDNHGLGGLRYTINNTEPTGQPMPCGETHSGMADITLDTTVNQVPGSSAGGGEGALKFMAEGTANISTDLRIWSEQAKGTNSVVKFWWVIIAANGSESKIIKSETTFNIPGGSQAIYSMKTFELLVAPGDRIALKALADKADGAFIESITPSKPMVDVKIKFKELLSAVTADDPFSGLDLSMFDEIYTSQTVVTKSVTNRDCVSINFDKQPVLDLVVLNAVKDVSGVITPVKNLQYTYNNDSKILHVSFGEVSNVKLTIGIYTL